MTPGEMRARAKSMEDHLRDCTEAQGKERAESVHVNTLMLMADLWRATAEVCERLTGDQ